MESPLDFLCKPLCEHFVEKQFINTVVVVTGLTGGVKDINLKGGSLLPFGRSLGSNKRC